MGRGVEIEIAVEEANNFKQVPTDHGNNMGRTREICSESDTQVFEG